MRFTATTLVVISLVSIGLGILCLSAALFLAAPAHAANLEQPVAQFTFDAATTSLSQLAAAGLGGSALVLLGLRLRAAARR